MKSSRKVPLCLPLLALAITVLGAQALFAATHCVNPSGSHGCFASINAAITASGPGDIIHVARGSYGEDVVIPKPISLVGAGKHDTIINAIGLANGIDIDGQHHPGLNHVTVTGFTIENANFSGILVTNASAVTITDNNVITNDKNLGSTGCTNLPPEFERGEAIDCGEGIQLSGVDHSTFSNNLVERNAGGILVADDTGATHDNVITENTVQNNTPDCGITLASHSPAGVFRNTVSVNKAAYNGGAGVGIFAGGPGNQAYSNVVLNNQITGNGLPGVTMHNHAAVPGLPPAVLSDNVIVGNIISRNAADTADAATSGPTGINLFSLTPMPGTIINQNTIFDESLDVAINIPPGTAGSAPDVQVHLNNLFKPVGVQNTGAAPVDATENWWGCPSGPGSRRDCSSVVGSNVTFNPWLTRPQSLSFLAHESD